MSDGGVALTFYIMLDVLCTGVNGPAIVTLSETANSYLVLLSTVGVKRIIKNLRQ